LKINIDENIGNRWDVPKLKAVLIRLSGLD